MESPFWTLVVIDLSPFKQPKYLAISTSTSIPVFLKEPFRSLSRAKIADPVVGVVDLGPLTWLLAAGAAACWPCPPRCWAQGPGKSGLYCTVLYCTMRYDMIRYDTIRCHTMPYDAILYSILY